MKGCLKSTTASLSATALQSYCTCAADSVTPAILAMARSGKPTMTPELTALAQSCAGKLSASDFIK
jgi:hypothetical protein